MLRDDRIDKRKCRDTVFMDALREFAMSVDRFDERVGVEYTDSEIISLNKVKEEKERVFVRDKEFRTVFHRKRMV